MEPPQRKDARVRVFNLQALYCNWVSFQFAVGVRQIIQPSAGRACPCENCACTRTPTSPSLATASSGLAPSSSSSDSLLLSRRSTLQVREKHLRVRSGLASAHGLQVLPKPRVLGAAAEFQRECRVQLTRDRSEARELASVRVVLLVLVLPRVTHDSYGQ